MPTQNTKSKSKSTLEEYVKEMLDKYEFNDAYTVMLGVALMNYKTAAFLCLNITADYKKAKDRRRNSKTVKELWKIYKKIEIFYLDLKLILNLTNKYSQVFLPRNQYHLQKRYCLCTYWQVFLNHHQLIPS